MNLEFIKLEIQNFKSVGELIEIDYRELTGLNFVYGKNLDVPNAKNGSGKTTIFEALVFALFGKTLKNTNNKYIPNRNVSDKLKPYAKVYLRSNGQMYSIETYGKVVSGIMSTTGMELLKLNDDFSIIEDLTQSSIIKTKQYILDNILGCTFDIFKSSIFLSSSDFMNFFEGMGKDAKRKYIENIFNLNCFGEMFSLIKADINDTKKEVQYIKNDILTSVDRLKDLENKFNFFSERAQKEQDELKNKIIIKATELKKLKDERNSIQYDNSRSFSFELKAKQAEISKLEKEKSSLERKNIEASSEIKHSLKLIEELKSIKDGLCEKCKALMDERYDLNHNVETINNLKSEIENNKKLIDTIKESSSKLSEEYDTLYDEYSESNLIVQKINKLDMSINYATTEIKNLKLMYDNQKLNEENPFTELLIQTKNNLKSLKQRLIEYNLNLKHLDILKEACSETGLKRFILKDIVKLLNSLIQKYLNEIGSEMIVYFDETMDFTFLTQSGECEFSSFSAGEKQRIQIATMFAFRDLILNSKIFSNLFIIDEMLDMNIDSICIENIMKILKRKSNEQTQSMFIISHRSELADNEGYWNNIIKVTKENGISHYEIK